MDRFRIPQTREEFISRINEAQDFGLECFVRNTESIHEVLIRPNDSAELCMRSIEATGVEVLADLEFSFQPAENVFQMKSSLVDGAGEIRPEEFGAVFQKHPLEKISTHRALAELLNEHFGSGSDWRVYTCLMRALPSNLPEPIVERLLVPLLSAGEITPALPDVEEYLRRRGWSDEQIQASYNPEERTERSARHYFFQFTGTPVSEVATRGDLFDAIEPTWRRRGNEQALSLIVMYVQAHTSKENVTYLPYMLEPFIDRFGPEGHTRIVEAYWACKHTVPYAPTYDGIAYPPLGEPL